MTRRILFLCGVLAPLVHLAAVVLGGVVFLFGLGVLGLMMTLGTILATLFVGLVAKAHPALSVYTLVSTGVILVTGGAAAASERRSPRS